ncbi:MAG: hypothetical protein MUF72_11935 [Elainella sp. Prado103]|jgi:Ca2+-binding RTX toxin-like protein|nr:hypothetical protein [Elainella sp. Prado103]
MVKRFKTLFNNLEIEKEFGNNRVNQWEGSSLSDVFFAKGGSDVCNGGKGADGIDGGSGDDTIEGGSGDDELYGGAGDDDISGGAGKDKLYGDAGDDTLDGGSGADLISGGEGDDTANGGSGKDQVYGDAGDDNISGDSGNDFLDGGDGNDFVSGNTGDDRMIGGLGDDTLDWDDGDGNDVMSGGEGRDTIEVDGSVSAGDNFVLNKAVDGRAFFERVGLNGQPVGRFNLLVDTAEVFDISGDGGNDTLMIGDLLGTGVESIQFDGGEGNDVLDGRNTTTHITAIGGNGDDILTGGTGTITLINPATNLPITLGDTLTGGGGKDKFQFLVDPFAGKPQTANLNQPDVITDYELGGIDQLVFGKQQFGISQLNFQKGEVTQLQDGNLLVLEGKFRNAGEAAQAIAANNTITAEKGLFVYYNETLGFSRVVHSTNLANGGAFSVQANLTNLTSASFQSQFVEADFALA